MKKLLLLLLVTMLGMSSVNAQRYLTPQFTAVTKTRVVYGTNYTVLAVPVVGRTLRQPLQADLYVPEGDTATKRPVVIYLITGNFLPRVTRTAASGALKDSAAVEIATRMAKMGYVALVCEYRLGWNPVSQIQEVRVNTLINAAYRGIQDARTAIRYMKSKAADYKIDTSKIILWGQGTGGYISLAAAGLDSYQKAYTTTKPVGKFFGSNGLPMVIEQSQGFYINGDVEGKILGRVPPGVTGPPPAGDTLNLPNHVEFGSKFQMCVNMGGAIGDSSWIDKNTPPIVSFQTPYDLFAPYGSAVLTVPVSPTVALPIVEVQGAQAVAERVDQLGLNKGFDKLKAASDPYKTLQASRNGGKYLSGLLPMYGDTITDSSPWEFFDQNDTLTKYAKIGNPRISAAKARLYIDSIITFVAPRACVALQLPCASLVSTTEELLTAENTKLVVAPNPAQKYVAFESDVYNPIQSIDVFDLSGRSVFQARNIKNHFYQMDRGSLPNGLYIAKVKFEGGILTKKIVLEQQ